MSKSELIEMFFVVFLVLHTLIFVIVCFRFVLQRRGINKVILLTHGYFFFLGRCENKKRSTAVVFPQTVPLFETRKSDKDYPVSGVG